MDFDRAVLSLEPGDTKYGKRRIVPLNDEALAALRDQREWVRVSVPRSPWVFAVASGDRMTTIQKGFCATCVRAFECTTCATPSRRDSSRRACRCTS
ncbi:site-specific integrase [Burkholderia ubonensis]|uniref:site-specific integrase n=1 Tax=Burkholderia ubonensis TaxID=101571 RepID=UPI001E44EA24|nr:site-specific integrase [Burkholderia ubonensis]